MRPPTTSSTGLLPALKSSIGKHAGTPEVRRDSSKPVVILDGINKWPSSKNRNEEVATKPEIYRNLAYLLGVKQRVNEQTAFAE
jgi:hypothetical protein